MKPIEFRETCGACPEAYDVHVGEDVIGHIKLRYGKLIAFLVVESSEEFPRGEEIIFSHDFDNDWQGIFGDQPTREYFLSLILAKFIERASSLCREDSRPESDPEQP